MLSERDDVTEKRMFGGIAFMVRDYMTVGIAGEDMMVRVLPEKHAAALKLKGARPMDFTGRPLKGFVYVAPDAVKTKAALRRWVERGLEFAEAQPPKKKKKKSSRVKAKRTTR